MIKFGVTYNIKKDITTSLITCAPKQISWIQAILRCFFLGGGFSVVFSELFSEEHLKLSAGRLDCCQVNSVSAGLVSSLYKTLISLHFGIPSSTTKMLGVLTLELSACYLMVGIHSHGSEGSHTQQRACELVDFLSITFCAINGKKTTTTTQAMNVM